MSVDVPGHGNLLVDIVYGGAFYALIPVSQYKLTKTSSKEKIRKAAGDTTGGLNRISIKENKYILAENKH